MFEKNNKKFISSPAAAELLGVTDGALRQQRHKARPLFPYSKVGPRVFYSVEDIYEILKRKKQEPIKEVKKIMQLRVVQI